MTQLLANPNGRQQMLTLLFVAGVGALLSIVLRSVVPSSPAQPPPQGDGLQFVWMHFVQSYFMGVVVFLAMVLFASYRRGRFGWIFAFAAGGMAPNLLFFHWMK